ncbi:double-strand break repair protein AddB [Thalassospira sp. TSL5-1]|uniref:double-strand break repair protein AddB n=1 Tax=Thalassospira sp. TSL5-1 TaxID=1544451 RepID=UPI000A54A022|nr:double-strand break repair protein AddB [Thalassospira sp. TSL5-1]
MTENLFYIPPGAPFADMIARQLLRETADQPVILSDTLLLVPNRRSCKVMRDAFLRQTEGRVTLLPTIRPLGEADEDELAMFGKADQDVVLNLPPAIPDLQRKLLLTRLIMSRADYKGEKPTADQAARLAGELARFLDQVQTENCQFDDLEGLVPAEFAQHWQLTLEFLQILTKFWPDILADQGVSDRAARRNAMIAAQIELWQSNPPAYPVIVAGSTAPFPALRDLMGAVLALPQGRVVLPGLMTGLSAGDWLAIADDAAHPQHLLSRLLTHIDHSPATVRPWGGGDDVAMTDDAPWDGEDVPPYFAEIPYDGLLDDAYSQSYSEPVSKIAPAGAMRDLFDDVPAPESPMSTVVETALPDDRPLPPADEDGVPSAQAERRRLVREALRPAQTTDQWRYIRNFAPDVLDGVLRVDCSGAREEAATIALMMRQALEQPGKTCALVTPDRGLARRVATELRRWEVDVDDSAGVPLHDTAPAIFLRLVVRTVQEQFAPVPLLELLKHPLCAAGMAPETFRTHTRLLELQILRGPRPGPGLDGLISAIDGWRDETIDRIGKSNAANAAPRIERIRDDHNRLCALVSALEAALLPLRDLMDDKTILPVEALRTHVRCCEILAATDQQEGADRLWRGDAGEALADFVYELLQALPGFEVLQGARYGAFLDALMADRAVRPRFGKHPRLFIWGTVEAQMQQADLTILGGLNEGVWPPEAGSDPWMSRPMRRKFGLPAPEHRIGQSAHDFQQLFCAPQVVMTRALRVGGTPTVPSRWLLRIENILRKSGIVMERADAAQWRQLADQLDEPTAEMRVRIGRPAPTPPIEARPNRLSVTQIETWMRDPYAIYARHILKLQRLDDIDLDPGAADYGNYIHEALDRFISQYHDHLPADSENRLLMIGEEVFAPLKARPGLWAFWWPRFQRIAKWFVQTEAGRRAYLRASFSERQGSFTLGSGFEVYARADRVDVLRDGGIAIIDYKTGVPPTARDVMNGFAPQLPLEGAIAEQGGFEAVEKGPPASYAFWKLSGGDPAGEIREIDTAKMKTTPHDLAQNAIAGVAALATAFADATTPYLSVPHPDNAPKYSDYVHLSRAREWMGSEETSDDSPALLGGGGAK